MERWYGFEPTPVLPPKFEKGRWILPPRALKEVPDGEPRDLLLLLLNSRGGLVSYHDISVEVIGTDDVDAAKPWIYVMTSTLRSAFGRLHWDPQRIINVRGEGYTLIPF